MNYRQKAKDLVSLATDARTPENERANAMVQAVKMIKEHDLLSSPLDGLIGNSETAQAFATVANAVTDPAVVDGVKKILSGLGRRRAAPRASGTRRR